MEQPSALALIVRNFCLAAIVVGGCAGTARADDCADCGPVQLAAKYTQEYWHLASGGAVPGSAGIAKGDVSIDVDGERALHLPAVHFFGRVIFDSNGSISVDHVGDAQGISSIEAYSAYHVYEAWAERSFAGSHGSVRVGLYDLNSEFDSIPTAGLFANPSHGIGRDFSQSGRAGPSIFPLTSLALRVAAQMDEQWALRFAVLDAVPGNPERPKANTIHLDSEEGALMVAELDYASGRIGKLGIGTWYYTARFADLVPAQAAMQGDQRGALGAYAFADVQVHQWEGSHPRSLSAFLRYGVADPRVHHFGSYLGSGIVLTGALREDDQLGLAMARAINGRDYRSSLALQGMPSNAAETNLELTWRVPLRKWLAIQPDVQYVFNPNTDPTLRDALVVGIRVEFSGGFP
jgi:porin